ncbi:MAG: hypothetical protein KDE28_23595, partial [Anaerolineales bacterium]|nr:hypothetical protein [Anaerolineales bacterium]
SEVESRLANYHPIETDPIILTEMERLIRSGLRNPDVALPAIPPLARAPRTVQVESRGRRRRRR